MSRPSTSDGATPANRYRVSRVDKVTEDRELIPPTEVGPYASFSAPSNII